MPFWCEYLDAVLRPTPVLARLSRQHFTADLPLHLLYGLIQTQIFRRWC